MEIYFKNVAPKICTFINKIFSYREILRNTCKKLLKYNFKVALEKQWTFFECCSRVNCIKTPSSKKVNTK